MLKEFFKIVDGEIQGFEDAVAQSAFLNNFVIGDNDRLGFAGRSNFLKLYMTAFLGNFFKTDFSQCLDEVFG